MKHLAIIMDGNRRWAHENALSAISGHDKGAHTLTKNRSGGRSSQNSLSYSICFFGRKLE